MLQNLGTKVALKKVGLSADTFDLSSLTGPSAQPRREPNKLRKKPPALRPEDYDDDDDDGGWSSWMPSIKSLPLTVQPWLAPKPVPVAVSQIPTVGDPAPVDRDGKLKLGGRRALVVFMRCVGCACNASSFYYCTIRYADGNFNSRPEDLYFTPVDRQSPRRHDTLHCRLAFVRPRDQEMD